MPLKPYILRGSWIDILPPRANKILSTIDLVSNRWIKRAKNSKKPQLTPLGSLNAFSINEAREGTPPHG